MPIAGGTACNDAIPEQEKLDPTPITAGLGFCATSILTVSVAVEDTPSVTVTV